ncbi:MAG TPA: VWA domain-containing protein [bacterium]|nr:VWA domain-containing protein [bacterium]
MFRFQDPWLLAALVLAPLVVLLHRWVEGWGRPRIVFSDLSAFKEVPASNRARLRHSVIALRALTIATLVFALSRPQYGNREQEILSKGIDIMIVLDVSTSMQAKDMEPNRLGAAKAVARRFVEEREKGLQNDRIGLVVFSRIAFTQCPLTVDYTILKQIIGRAQFTRQEFDGTAIGTALATAVSRLKDSKAKSKVVILVTDGQNNQGIDPMTAAGIAEAMKVKVYTIGIVPTGIMRKVQSIFGMSFVPAMATVDESQMKEIARVTGGKYYRATDEQAFKQIFDDIDKLEKTEVKVKEFYRYSEAFGPWAAAALLLLIAELAIGRTVFRSLP